MFDHNNDSYIDHEEIKRTMHFLGETVTDDDVRAMIQEADADHDGLVDFEGKITDALVHNFSQWGG